MIMKQKAFVHKSKQEIRYRTIDMIPFDLSCLTAASWLATQYSRL